MSLNVTNIFLADDDEDDQFMFREALTEIKLPTSLIIANDGEELMSLLRTSMNKLPDVLFLDLNMPRKNGFQCLREIKEDEKLIGLKTIVFSTTPDHGLIQRLYKNGADHYIKKPTDFNELKRIIEGVLKINGMPATRTSIEKFVLK